MAEATTCDSELRPHAVRVWDLGVRVFHWSLATLFLLNFAILDEDSMAHQWVGYAVVALVVLRLAWGVIGTQYARFACRTGARAAHCARPRP